MPTNPKYIPYKPNKIPHKPKKKQKWEEPDRKSKLKLDQDFLWIVLGSSRFMMGFLKAFSFSKRPLAVAVMVLIPP